MIGSDLGDNPAEGALTETYLVDAQRVRSLLETSVASEQVASLDCMAQALHARELRAPNLYRLFREASGNHRQDMDRLIQRSDDLGAPPDLHPSTLESRSLSSFQGPDEVPVMVQSRLDATRKQVDFYRESIQWLVHRDPVTRRLLEEILAGRERLARELSLSLG